MGVPCSERMVMKLFLLPRPPEHAAKLRRTVTLVAILLIDSDFRL